MYHYSTVANSSLFQTTSHLTQTLLKYSVLNIDKIAELQQTVHSILKRLKASELESLLRALESRGGDVSKCVFVPSDVENEPEVTLYQIFRQPSIASANDLKPLAVCSHRDGKRVCINPYHYSRLVHIGKLLRSFCQTNSLLELLDRTANFLFGYLFHVYSLI